MIPYLNSLLGSMCYLDVHTHRLATDPQVVSIVSTLVQPMGEEMQETPYRSFGIHPCRIEEDG